MDVVSASPLAVGSVLWQAKALDHRLTIVAKATFSLEPGLSVLAADQLPLEPWSPTAPDGAPPSDLAPLKVRADVVVVGGVHPGVVGSPVLVRLAVGGLEKALEVVAQEDGPLPLLAPLGPAGKLRSALVPAGSSFPGSWPAEPAPEALDRAYFSVAPRDQQLPIIQGDEVLVLDGVLPGRPHLETRLPGISPRVWVETPGGRAQDLALYADQLVIHSREGVCTVTWRGRVKIDRPEQPGRVLVGLATPHGAPELADVLRAVGASPELGVTPAPVRRATGSTLLGQSLSQLKPHPLERTADSTIEPAPPTVPFQASHAAVPPRRTSTMPFQDPRALPASPLSDPRPYAPGELPPLPPPPPPLPPGLSMAQPPPLPPVLGEVTPLPPAVVPAQAQQGAWLSTEELARLPSGLAPAAPPPVTGPPAMLSGAAAMVGAPTVGVPTVGAPTVGAAAMGAPALAGTLSGAPMSGGAPTIGMLHAAAAEGSAPVVAAPSPKKRPPPRGLLNEAIDLLWADPAVGARVRARPAFAPVLDALAEAEPDPELDDPALAKSAKAQEDKRDVFEVLANAEPDTHPLELLLGAVRADGKVVPPLGLFVGELMLGFDERAVLEATAAAVAPFAPLDETLRAAFDAAQALLAQGDKPLAPSVLDAVLVRLRETAAQKRVVPAGLDAQVERALTLARAFVRRKVLGEPHVRATLVVGGAATSLPTYLTLEAAEALPLSHKHRVRVLADVHLALDAGEAASAALVVRGLARLVPLPKR
jgi:hypothetical protein